MSIWLVRTISRAVGISAAAVLLFPAAMKADDEPKGEIKEPRHGDKIEGVIIVEGRTRDIPDGWSVYVFTQEEKGRKNNPELPGTWPHGPVEPGRRFEELKLIGKQDGKLWIQLFALPPGREKLISDWRKARKEYEEKFGRVGAPYLKQPELFAGAVRLAEVEIEHKK